MTRTTALVCHPHTPCAAVRAIEVRVSRAADGSLALGFSLDGALDRLRVPPAGPPRIGHALWRHTCFEAFVRVDGAAEYHELNLSPSGEWAVHAFSGYRDGAPLTDDAAAPRLEARRLRDRLELDAQVPLDRLASSYSHAPLRLALATVVEEVDGALSYWSLHHPPGAPDFHHADAFALRLEPLAAAC